jgi:hypothetical protein
LGASHAARQKAQQEAATRMEILAELFPEQPPFQRTVDSLTRLKWGVVLFNSDEDYRALQHQNYLAVVHEGIHGL